ncbi:TetR/AcrR family transcriptional regulator [Humibacillus xanthopallidus]|uniref:TetR/AcrR family transcriptional regulator n=1 Tax=Humibacillus xanthopallidus TaxID=412689 RepID=UPI00163AE81C|nr:TetR/AcrR family transcriptional regulator [Humibacillus xanthopallidus]
MLLDHVKALWAEHGVSCVTIRALSKVSGVSNGAIYNAFGSRDNLLARTWSREAEQFLSFQREAVDTALTNGDATSAVVAAALAPSDYFSHDAPGARLLLTVTLDELARANVGATERQQLRARRRSLGLLINQLAREVWGSADDASVTFIKLCLVDLPSSLLLAGDRITDPLARVALERAVRGVLATPPPAG